MPINEVVGLIIITAISLIFIVGMMTVIAHK